MTIGVIYCETLESEIQAVAAPTARPTILEPMPWGLHIEPERLLSEVRGKIMDLQERVDVIVLGYGRCQAFDRLGGGFKVPVLRPAAEDCIGVLLGQERYDAELQRVPGTWFLSPVSGKCQREKHTAHEHGHFRGDRQDPPFRRRNHRQAAQR